MATPWPDGGGLPPWRALGRLLPVALRERVFEPAYYDLLAREGEGAHAVPLGLRVLGLVLETWRVGWPGLLVGLWRTRRVRWALAVACGLLFVVFILTSYGYQ